MPARMANRENGRAVGVDLSQIKSESKIEFQCPIHVDSQVHLHSEDQGSAERIEAQQRGINIMMFVRKRTRGKLA